MTKVYNWQLGRDMDYPYEGAPPERQFAFVFNINRCIACQSCTMACKSTWTFEIARCLPSKSRRSVGVRY